MDRNSYRSLIDRVAWCRHRMWCLASEDKDTGLRTGDCTSTRGNTNTQCCGPKPADVTLGEKVVLELYGPEPAE